MTKQSVSHVHRLELLARCPVFASLPAVIIEHMSKSCQERSCHKGEVIVAEGDVAHSLYIIVYGEVSVTQRGASGTLELGQLRHGELFGETGLLATDSKRSATVVANTDCTLLRLSKSDFDFLTHEYPYLKKAFLGIAETYQMANALKRNDYFASLDGAILRALAKRVQSKSVEAGEFIVKQDEPGSSCYYIKSGEVEVWRDSTEKGREKIALLGPGEVFGEAAALTGLRRNASIVANKNCELLVILQSDLTEIMQQDKKVARNMINLLFLRNLPEKSPNLTVETRKDANSKNEYLVRSGSKPIPVVLNEEEFFVWEQIDGNKNLKDLTLAFHKQFKVFVPQRVSEILSELIANGLVSVHQPLLEFGERGAQKGLWNKLTGLMERKFICHDIDKKLTTLYNKFFWIFFTIPAQLLFLAIVLAGAAVFYEQGYWLIVLALNQQYLLPVFFMLLPIFLVASVLHEGAHAFTVKKFGRTVLGVGIGWHWLGPAFFVDTSDMWTASKWKRVAVRLAGLYANLVLAGFCSLLLLLSLPELVKMTLWFFSLSSYILILVYLNPFIKSYGYFAQKELREG